MLKPENKKNLLIIFQRKISLGNKQICLFDAICDAFFLINTNRHISPHLVTFCHISDSGEMWRKFFYFLIKCGGTWRHNLILYAPQCTTLRHNLTHFYVAPCDATICHVAPCDATICHVAQKLQMNVFRNISIKIFIFNSFFLILA